MSRPHQGCGRDILTQGGYHMPVIVSGHGAGLHPSGKNSPSRSLCFENRGRGFNTHRDSALLKVESAISSRKCDIMISLESVNRRIARSEAGAREREREREDDACYAQKQTSCRKTARHDITTTAKKQPLRGVIPRLRIPGTVPGGYPEYPDPLRRVLFKP